MKRHSTVLTNVPLAVQKCEEELTGLQRLLASSLDVICSIDIEGRFTYASPASLHVWGYTPQEIIGRKFMDMVVPEDRPKTALIAEAMKPDKGITSFENRYRKKDGSVVPMLWSAKWSNEEQIMYCVAKDATPIKELEKQKLQQDQRLHRAYHLAKIAWWEYDVATQTYTSSDEIFLMYGLPVPENNQNSLQEFLSLVHPDDVARLQHDITTIAVDTYINYEHRIVKPSGEVIYVIHYSEVIRDSDGNPVAIHGTTKDITQRKLQQLALEASERKLQQYSKRLTETLESIGDGFFTVDQNWTVTYWNRKAEELLCKKREDILGSNLLQEFKEAMPLKFYSECHRAQNEGTTVQFEEYLPPLRKWIEATAYPSAEGLAVYFKDITERKWQQEALQLANERFELATKATSDALYDWDILSNTCYFTEAFTTLFGHENKTDLVFKNWVDNIHEGDKEEVAELLNEALNNAAVQQFQCEYRFYRADKTLAYVLDRGFIIRNGEGRALRMVGSMQDITTWRETEAEMKKLSLVARETANVVVITDAEGKITWVNKAFTTVTEYSFEEAVGKKPGDLLQGPNTSEQTKNYLRMCVEKRLSFHCEILNYTQSGRAYWMEIKGQPVFDESGRLEQFIAIQTDITNRKEAEAAIKLSEEKYRRLFHKTLQPKLTFHAETLQIVDVNKAACDLYGYNREEFLRLRISDLRKPDEVPELVSIIDEFKRKPNGVFNKVVAHRKKSGEVFYIEITSSPIDLPTGLHFMVSGTDMTEKLQLQQQVIAEKVAAQKKVARAIIHAQEAERSVMGKELHDNVCQLLTTSKLYIENIRHCPGQQETFLKKGVDLLMQAINEIRYLSHQLVSPVLNETCFKATIEELLHHYRSLNLFEIDFSYEADADLLDKELKTTIIRILQEAFNNTVKYAKASVVQVCIGSTAAALRFSYSDNGVGFDPAITKRGIGLSNIKNRADAYGGKVNVKAAVGEGCTIEIAFPLLEKIEPTKM